MKEPATSRFGYFTYRFPLLEEDWVTNLDSMIFI
jgi:hypothetical protein